MPASVGPLTGRTGWVCDCTPEDAKTLDSIPGDSRLEDRAGKAPAGPPVAVPGFEVCTATGKSNPELKLPQARELSGPGGLRPLDLSSLCLPSRSPARVLVCTCVHITFFL